MQAGVNDDLPADTMYFFQSDLGYDHNSSAIAGPAWQKRQARLFDFLNSGAFAGDLGGRQGLHAARDQGRRLESTFQEGLLTLAPWQQRASARVYLLRFRGGYLLRRVALVIAVVAVAVIAYVSSAIWSVTSLLLAVRTGDGPAIVRQTDIPRLRNMLVAQIVEAYLDRIGGKRQLERLAVAAYGPTVADALVGKILDEGLTRLLHDGVVQDPAKPSAHVSLAPFGALKPGELAELASRIRPFKLARVRSTDQSV